MEDLSSILSTNSALAYAASASVNDTLIGAMSDEEWPVREVAAETIGKIGLNTASQTLIVQAMEDEYWQVRVKAARSLGLIKSPTGVSGACHGIDPRYQQPP